ncbi:GntR family transcriptional regulator [Telmatospirillum siberiense]|uniref:Transcriptional regulator n=1 Tax=Telmatospirillum siberiense TaxID=382514 RepID=A0A2N3PUN7_9PROT|nr:GntR family transcriptional regulator [Telmatospirillum siberiense]PKU24113.1 transcriptional regulator [Telmatospirillum siberiense]
MNQTDPLCQKAYGLIREMIATGALDPDTALSERRLAETLGIGRTPVREAIKELTRDGLLSVSPMRGTFVRSLSLADLREIHEIRQALEGAAAFRAAQCGPGKALGRLADALRALSARTEFDVDEAQRIGWDFHQALFDATGNRRLIQMYETLRAQNGLALQGVPGYDAARSRQAILEHLQIFAAIETGDAEQARRRMWDHLAHALDARLRFIAGLAGEPQQRTEP